MQCKGCAFRRRAHRLAYNSRTREYQRRDLVGHRPGSVFTLQKRDFLADFLARYEAYALRLILLRA